MEEAELSWTLKDYHRKGIDPPSRLEFDVTACEGRLMTDDEILEYISDGVRTIKVLKDHNSDRLEDVKLRFFADLEFLVSIDRLELDDYHELVAPETYEF